MNIILDKSYLQGEQRSNVHKLFERHRILLPDVLFYELMTTDSNSRAKCFIKIPDKPNPCILIKNAGALLKYELETKRSYGHITKHQERIGIYQFNKMLRDKDFQFLPYQVELNENFERETKEDTKRFVKRAFVTADFFKELHGLQGEELSQHIDSLIYRISTDNKLVKKIYGVIIPENDARFGYRVNPESIGQNWAIYRWIQSQIIYGLRFYKKYGGNIPNDITDKFWTRAEHDMLDAEYVMLGALSDGIASRDKSIIDTLKMISPNKFIF